MTETKPEYQPWELAFTATATDPPLNPHYTSWYGVRATDRDALIGHAKWASQQPPNTSFPSGTTFQLSTEVTSSVAGVSAPPVLLMITCADAPAEPVVFATADDIPDHDVPCPCGNPKHWAIKYGNDL